jgi:hypothetical protein
VAGLSPAGAEPAVSSAVSPAGLMMQQQHRSYVDADGAVVIGRLRVGPKELGFGSAGEANTHKRTGLWRRRGSVPARVQGEGVSRGQGQLWAAASLTCVGGDHTVTCPDRVPVVFRDCA